MDHGFQAAPLPQSAALGPREDSVCWRDILQTALHGLYPSDEHLERLLDHLERTP
ncbi:hypothetical protein [Pseudaestuariivita sp.]|uniref:hypothetical protein n=1 Tax=Pseudaestuariivita sp. TaxID=2211669 RepID=UPI004057DBD8